MHLLAATSTGSGNTTALVVDVILAVLFAYFGYRSSEKFRRQWGRTPWGWPSALWGVVCFISILLGVILLFFARRGTRRRIQQSGAFGNQYGGYPGGAPPGMPPPYQGPTQGQGNYGQGNYGQGNYGQGNYGQPSYEQPGPAQPEQTPWGSAPPPASPPPQAPGSVQPNWYPDPSGKHQYRYYDGSRWTDDVSDNGVALKDPLPS